LPVEKRKREGKEKVFINPLLVNLKKPYFHLISSSSFPDIFLIFAKNKGFN